MVSFHSYVNVYQNVIVSVYDYCMSVYNVYPYILRIMFKFNSEL